jgi:hypothetical protein
MEFRFESRNEVIGPVLEENDKAERKEDKEQKPKESADKSHGAKVN